MWIKGILATASWNFGPEKTRMLAFRSPGNRKDPGEDDGPPANACVGGDLRTGNFDFLGFTHHWAKSKKRFWVVRQKTSKGRFTKALQRIKAWCRTNRHLPVREQQEALSRKLKGHYGYYGVTGNSLCLGRFRNEVGKLWKKGCVQSFL